jgi:hypothetical protein
MIGVVLVCSALVAWPADDPKGATGATAGAKDREKDKATGDEARTAALAAYNGLREKTPETAAAQWKLAVWCEQNGLNAEAYAQYAAVVRLDPRREAAWRKLGFKKYDGRWLTDDQVAEEQEQKKAEKVWAPRLKRWHRDVHGTGKRAAEAQAALDEVADPKAVPSVYREFGGGGQVDQLIAVQVLGHIDSAVASKTLAVLAVYGRTPEVRRRAIETLRGRPDREYLDVLIGLMVDPVKYEVKPVAGPGSPGVLLVEGERFNVRRLYAAPAAPNVVPKPGDIITYDELGMPVITRPFAVVGFQRLDRTGQLLLKRESAAQFSATQNMIEAQRGAAAAQAQLQNDVAAIESVNDEIKRFNELVIAAAKDATGKDRGRTPQAWRDALAAENKYDKTPARNPDRPTLDLLIPLGYNPTFARLTFISKVTNDA